MGDTHDEDHERPSRSARKRESRDLQDLGRQLVALPESDLAAVPLPDELRAAVEAARRITSHGALARQRLYIGKLLRRIDPEPIRAALSQRGETDRRRVLGEKSVGAWRDRLLADEGEAWAEIGSTLDAAVVHELQALARQARAEHGAARPPAAARRLFRRLRELLDTMPQ
jgi:ribosome-associated protein